VSPNVSSPSRKRGYRGGGGHLTRRSLEEFTRYQRGGEGHHVHETIECYHKRNWGDKGGKNLVSTGESPPEGLTPSSLTDPSKEVGDERHTLISGARGEKPQRSFLRTHAPGGWGEKKDDLGGSTKKLACKIGGPTEKKKIRYPM